MNDPLGEDEILTLLVVDAEARMVLEPVVVAVVDFDTEFEEEKEELPVVVFELEILIVCVFDAVVVLEGYIVAVPVLCAVIEGV